MEARTAALERNKRRGAVSAPEYSCASASFRASTQTSILLLGAVKRLAGYGSDGRASRLGDESVIIST